MQNKNNTQVVPFNFGTQQVRVVTLEGEPWFVAVDVRDALGITQGGTNLHYLADSEKRAITKGSGLTTSLFRGTSSRVSLISEAGLYKLVMRSDKPEARTFQDWVTREVLPSIRKTGAFVTGQPSMVENPLMDPLDLLMAQAQLLPKMIEQMREQKALIQQQAEVIQAVQAKVEDILNHLTIAEFCRTHKLFKLTHGDRAMLGKAASESCRTNGWSIKQHPFSNAGMYPVKALAEAATKLKIAA